MDNYYTLLSLISRNIKLFLRDRASVFFSLLAPIIVLMLYVLFLGDVQIDGIKQFFLQLVNSGAISADSIPTDKAIKGVVDSWMLGGVLAITCLTVSLSANNVMVKDKSCGVLSDSLASPVKKWVVVCSYYVFNFIVTVAICSILFIVCLIYKSFGGLNMSFIEVLCSFGILLLSALSATLFTVLITSFLHSESALNSIVGIFSAAVGFLIGAYMPINTFPKVVQYVVGIFPGTHSAGLFKNFMMQGALEKFSPNIPSEAINGLKETFGMEINFFKNNIGSGKMILYLAGSIIVFAAINVLIQVFKSKDKKVRLRKSVK